MPHCRDCADHNGICPGSGKPCDPADAIVEMRSANPPFKTWRELGHLPFEMFGERFAVTRNTAERLGGELPWKVSHIDTGIAVPRTGSKTKRGAVENAKQMLAFVGEEKFKAALRKARESIACGE